MRTTTCIIYYVYTPCEHVYTMYLYHAYTIHTYIVDHSQIALSLGLVEKHCIAFKVNIINNYTKTYNRSIQTQQIIFIRP